MKIKHNLQLRSYVLIFVIFTNRCSNIEEKKKND